MGLVRPIPQMPVKASSNTPGGIYTAFGHSTLPPVGVVPTARWKRRFATQILHIHLPAVGLGIDGRRCYAPASIFPKQATPAESIENAFAFPLFRGTYRCIFAKPRSAWTQVSCTPSSRCHSPKNSSRSSPASVPLLVLSNIYPWRPAPPRAPAVSVRGATSLNAVRLGPFVLAPVTIPVMQTGHDCLAVHGSGSLVTFTTSSLNNWEDLCGVGPQGLPCLELPPEHRSA